MKICDYGCGKESNFEFKSGKNCCCKSCNSCPGLKKKNSKAMTELRKLKGDDYWYNGHPKGASGKDPWNKGLTKETDERLKEQAIKLSVITKKLYADGKITGRAKTEEAEEQRKKKLSVIAKNISFGGYVEGSGRGKKGRYKGFWCDSSWELAYVIYNIDNSIEFERNNKKFSYEFEEKTHMYLPDFIECDTYIEIKGYNTKQWLAKLNQFPEKIKVLYENDMKIYLDYTIKKYGKNFIKMYDTEG